MCGIVGYRGLNTPTLVKKMANTIAHRGPDDDGFFNHENFAMGMRRLSIIDLAHGQQPIFNEDRNIVVCYNGEIYNYLELRQQLIKLGHQFRTESDTEVIVHAYEQWGEQCLAHFNGMFAFALYDKNHKKVFIARDRCGQKPLYYYHNQSVFIFSSEVKAILATDYVPREVNQNMIDAYLTLRYIPEPQTLFKDIQTLPAAHYLTLDANNQLVIKRYWDIQLRQSNYLSPKAALAQLDQQLETSVKRVLRSDVPVGAYLSAGIDSSLLVALMSQSVSNINTYSIGFNSAIDETPEAAQTAKLLGTNHHTLYCENNDVNLLPKIIYHMDRPVGDALIIAFYKLAQLASRDVKVVVSGEGADEIFAGYPFHKVMLLFQRYFKIMPNSLHQRLLIPLLNSMHAGLLTKFFNFPASLGNEGKQHFVKFLKNYKQQSLFENYIALKTLWRPDSRQALYTESFKQQLITPWTPEVRDQQGHFLDCLLKLQWDEWLQDWAIIRQDKNTMAHSLEVRLPFLDHQLIELGFRMPPKVKANWLHDKIIERRLAKRHLPACVVKRPKKPFYFPLGNMVNCKAFQDLIHLTLNKQQVEKRGYFKPDVINQLLARSQSQEFIVLKQIVSLVVLELWHMIFIDKQMC